MLKKTLDIGGVDELLMPLLSRSRRAPPKNAAERRIKSLANSASRWEKRYLKVRFIDRIVAKMQLGGISQTRAALYESRRARHMHVSPISFRSEVKFLVFLVKHYLKGFLRVKQ